MPELRTSACLASHCKSVLMGMNSICAHINKNKTSRCSPHVNEAISAFSNAHFSLFSMHYGLNKPLYTVYPTRKPCLSEWQTVRPIYNTPIGTHYIEGVTKRHVNAKKNTTHILLIYVHALHRERRCLLAKSSKTLLAGHQRVDEHWLERSMEGIINGSQNELQSLSVSQCALKP